MLQISEFVLSTPEHGVLRREPSRQAAERAAARYTPPLQGYTITEEQRPAVAHGLCVAVGGLHRTWELVVGEADPQQGLYPVTERAALALGIGGHAGALRAPGIVTLASELADHPEIEHEATINTTHNRGWGLVGRDRSDWEALEYGPALRDLLTEPSEMRDRGVVMFNGLRTAEGQAIAQAFLAAFAAEKLVTENDDSFSLFAVLGDFQPRERSYVERVEAAQHSRAVAGALSAAIAPHCDGGPITPAKALVIADLMQLHSVLLGAKGAIYAMMPNGFRNDETAQEDFGSVSQRESFDPLRQYLANAATGVYEYLVNDINARDSLQGIAALGQGRSASTPVTGRELAERLLADPLQLIRQLVGITAFVRESNEASVANFAEHYAPALHARQQARDDERRVHAARRMAVDAIARASGVPL